MKVYAPSCRFHIQADGEAFSPNGYWSGVAFQ